MPEAPHISNVTLPIAKDFEAFRNECLALDDWVEVVKDSKHTVWSMKTSDSVIKAIRSKIIYEDIQGDVLYNVFQDHEYRVEWDDNMIEGSVVDLVKKNVEIGYYSAKVPSPVSNRDLCNLRAWRHDPGRDEYIIFNYSVKHDSCPEKKGFVRAQSLKTGYFIHNLEKGCEFIYYSQFDPKGWIPTWLINWYTTKAPAKFLEKIRVVALAYPEWKSKHNPDKMPWLDINGLEDLF